MYTVQTVRKMQVTLFFIVIFGILCLIFQSGVEAGKRERVDLFWGWYNCTDHEDGYPRCVFKFYDQWDAYLVDPVFNTIPEERKVVVKLIPMVAQE